MNAAEKLIAQKGLESVSIRDIVLAAGQKNESALQYHFKNLKGLISAIHARRSTEIQSKRAELIDQLLKKTDQPDLRQVCALMIQPVFELARDKVEFRRYIKAFGHELVLSESSALSRASSHGAGGASGAQTGALLKSALPHLSAEAFHHRMESAVRLCAATMYHQARQKQAFRNESADLFFHNLIDALVGLLSAEESADSKRSRKRAKTLKR